MEPFDAKVRKLRNLYLILILIWGAIAMSHIISAYRDHIGMAIIDFILIPLVCCHRYSYAKLKRQYGKN